MEASCFLNSCILCMNVIIKMQCKLQNYKICHTTMDDRPKTKQFKNNMMSSFYSPVKTLTFGCVCAPVPYTSHLMLITRVDNKN